jgi:acyl-[acyl-carrier-protein]-phospholipid O-acyltransferase / long-chain-fatty-acid--[acyl-carrier-protein] ligase
MTDTTTPHSRSLRWLQIAQALGAFNDNAWKMIVVALATRGLAAGADGEAEAQRQTMIAFAAFTGPLVLLSLPFGALADRFRKNEVLYRAKLLEVALMIAGTVALFMNPLGGWAPLLVLAAMGLQSAIFSPAKYGILPEIVPHHELTQANGRLELATFLAIIAAHRTGHAVVGARG